MFIHPLQRAGHLESIAAHDAANQGLSISRKLYQERLYFILVGGVVESDSVSAVLKLREVPRRSHGMREESVLFMIRAGNR